VTPQAPGPGPDSLSNIDSKIVLIDGRQLAQFMFEHNVGVAPASVYEVKKLDADFFEDE
jgi:restriction system protein